MTAAPDAGIVCLEACSKTFRRGAETVHALTDVSLTVAPGELVAVAGPSGSGKTTLLNLLIGWEVPDDGRVVWRDRAAGSGPPPWHMLGVVPQRLGLADELTVAENVHLPVDLGHRRDIDVQTEADLLDALLIGHLRDRLPDQISLGEQQRTAIARALVLGPTMLVLDEPTAHQDDKSAAAVMTALRTAALDGTCCVIASHAPDLLAVVDRIVHLADGRVVDAGP